MRAGVLSIGEELLRGDIVDTNAAFLNRELTELGFDVRRVWQVGDDRADLTGLVRHALHGADLVICTGGLGPTQDDLTRDAIAAALGEDQYVDADLATTLRERFAAMGRRMPDSNIQQAHLIPSARGIPNPNGSAPGWYVQRDGKTIVAMPGPPGEMQPMWSDWVRPRVAELLSKRTAARSLMTFGVGESHAEERIADVIAWRPDVTVATYAKSNGVQIHITAHAASSAEAEQRASEAEAMVRDRLGVAVYGTGDETLSHAVGRLLGEQDLTLAVMESATGGALADMVTSVDGSSTHFLGGIVSYSTDVKALFGVPRETMDRYGVISSQTAEAMARAVRQTLQADVALSVTGIAGSQPVEGKPGGTCYLGLATDTTLTSREIHRPGRRDTAKRYFANCALDLLRRHLERAEDAPE